MKKTVVFILAVILCCMTVLAACGKKDDTNAPGGPAHEHAFGEWKETKEPTCIDYGVRERKCACGEAETQKVDPFYEHYFRDEECIYCGALTPTEGLIYALTSSGDAYELIEAPYALSAVVVDNVHEGKPVIGIAVGAFKNSDAPQNVPQDNGVLQSVTLNRGIEYISGGAFYKCVNLRTVTLPATLVSIGANAFYGCEKLVTVAFPEGLEEIGTGAFQKCKQLKTAQCPASVKTVGASAFQGCTSLTSAVLQGVESLGASAFYGCTQLAQVVWENAPLTRVRSYTFYGCGKLTTMHFPATLKAIGSSAFANCAQLSTVQMPEGVTVASDAFEGTLLA